MASVDLFTYEALEGKAFKVRAKNGVDAGTMYMEIDGFYVFLPNPTLTGFYSEYALLAFYSKLRELNREWSLQIENLNIKGEPNDE